jgi:hypothetical protein
LFAEVREFTLDQFSVKALKGFSDLLAASFEQ